MAVSDGRLRQRLEESRTRLEQANTRIEKKAGRNLVFAIGSGLILGLLLIASLFFLKEVFVGFVALLVAMALIELATAFRTRKRRVPRFGAALSGAAIIVATHLYGAPGQLTALIAACTLLALWRLVEGRIPSLGIKPGTYMRDIFAGFFALVYIAFFAAFAVMLLDMQNGTWWVFTFIATVVAADIGAFAVGVNLGKHKMTPKISPNKSWEGFAGAAVLAHAVAIPLTVFVLQANWWQGCILAVTILATATLGDLIESLLKRTLGVKDMSSWLPGHGGLLDRLDSLLPSAVGAYGVALLLGVA